MSEVIHVKLEYLEALQSKKDILGSELGLLKIAKAIKRYQILRSDELKIKLSLHRKLSELKTNIGRLQQVLPKVKIPDILEEKRESPEKNIVKTKIDERAYDNSLEAQLEEIQARLKELG